MKKTASMIRNKNQNNRVQLYQRDDLHYKLLRKMVMDRFLKDYGAVTEPNPDLFVALDQIANKNISGACYGIQFASKHQLFSEAYLDHSIEHEVSKRFKKMVLREEIAEIGCFVSFNLPGSGSTLLRCMPWLFWSLGIRCVVITGTNHVIQLLRQHKIPFEPLESYPESKVSHQFKEQWGSYYQQSPVTGLIDIVKACETMINRSFQNFQITDCTLVC